MSNTASASHFAGLLDNLIRRIGQAVAWVNLLLIGVILIQVFFRHFGFTHGQIMLEEMRWHLYALAVMVGLSYGVSSDSHIRVDLLRHHFSPVAQNWIEIIGILFLLLPFLLVIFHHSLEWVADSFRLGESSENPTGLPYRWLIKAVIPISFGLLFIATLARLFRAWAIIRGKG
jgi:TRAP-type mannitol/chloroaromatic compound transport system permease small subunit